MNLRAVVGVLDGDVGRGLGGAVWPVRPRPRWKACAVREVGAGRSRPTSEVSLVIRGLGHAIAKQSLALPASLWRERFGRLAILVVLAHLGEIASAAKREIGVEARGLVNF